MKNELQGAIAVLRRKVAEQESALAATKKLVNQLCAEAGEEPIYSDLQEGTESEARPSRSDQYYGQPLATAVRRFLEGRQRTGPASVEEIYQALVKGGFQFEGKDVENAKRGLRISLTKNSVTFHKLPDGSYGLLSWYPSVKQPKSDIKDGESTEPEETEIPQERASASVSFFITKGQKAKLAEKGYTDEQISKMKPSEAHAILGLAAKAG